MPIEPMKWGQEIAVILIVAISISLLYTYRRRVIFMVTGDDRIHADILDCLNYVFCTCCGCTNFEWTRKLTSCPCCPEPVKNINLCRVFKRMLGMTPKIVEVKNIVCGDLPYDSVRGDFYVCISVGANPEMVTSLQEEKKPKVVHFPEILQLKVKDSPLEPRVVITVKELNIAGSDTLCEVKISPQSIVDWSVADEPLKRFQMRPLDSDIERETPPWIAMEFSAPSEPRLLDQIHDHLIHLFLPSNDRNSVQPAQHGSLPAGSDGTILGTRSQTQNSITDFKHSYTLLDDSGNPIEEPEEEDLAGIRHYRNCMINLINLFDVLVFLAVFLYLACRIYVWSCYRQFGWLTQAQLNGWPLLRSPQYPNGDPISNSHLADIRKKCKAATVGTGAIEGKNPCRPNFIQTLYVCENLPDENRPEAFVGLAHDWFGWNIKGVTCAHGVCGFHNQIAEYDHICVIGVIFLVISTKVCKYLGNDMVKSAKKRYQKRNTDNIHASKRRQESGGGLLPTHNLGVAAKWVNQQQAAGYRKI